MGMTPSQLEDYTFAQFNAKCDGFQDNNANTENYFRKLTYHLYAINSDPKKKFDYTLDDFWPTLKSVELAKKRNEKDSKKIEGIVSVFRKQKGLK